jgi:hypothetical protein
MPLAGCSSSSSPTKGSGAATPLDCTTKKCPIEYSIKVTALTRIGDIPIQGVAVKLDGAEIGSTDSKGTRRSAVSVLILGSTWKRFMRTAGRS